MNKTKRIFDFSFALIGLLVFIPILILVSLIIKVKMPGPVFFIQQRVGARGKLFKMVKFRSMAMDHHGNTISVKGEKRITPLGSRLRRYKIDELPELWNVLIGNMSFVGPRPDVPGYADKLEGDDRIVLSIRPGITGPASLKYSNEEELLSKVEDHQKYNDEILYPDKVRINKNYIKYWSLGLDIKIIIYTLLGKKLREPWLN